MDYIIVPIIWIVLIILFIAFIASNIVIVPQAKAYVERLGTYRDTWSTGLHFKVPLFERIARKVTLKEQVVGLPAASRLSPRIT